MAKGDIVFRVDADDADARKKLDDLNKDIEKSNKEINKTQAEIDKASQAVNNAENEHNGIVEQMEAARQAAKETRAEIDALNAQKAENDLWLEGKGKGELGLEEFEARRQAQAEIEYELQQQNAALAENEATMDRLAPKEEAALAKVEEKTAQLEKQKELLAQQNAQYETQVNKAGELERLVAAQTKSEAAQAAMKNVRDQFSSGFKGFLKWGLGIKSLFILFRKLKQFTVDAVKAFAEVDPETKKAIDGVKNGLSQLRAAWGAAFAPIFSAVAPAIQTLVSLLTRAANSIAMFMAILQGKSSYKRAIEDTEALGGALEETAGAAGKAKKQLSGLDEMNIWQGNGGGGSGGGGGGSQYEDVPIGPGDEEGGLGKLAAFVRDNLESVELVVDEFLFVIGLILAASGNIPLGLGLMVYAGYKGVQNITENWGAIKSQLQGTMGEILAIVNAALLSIGIILLLTGANIPLGLGLMVIGAAGMATAITANWDSTSEKVQHVVGVITGVVSGALLAIGFLLLMSVNPATIALGIGLLALGAAGLVATAKLDWEAAQTKVGGVVNAIVTVVSGALLALGALLTFSGFNIPLGIALLAAGAVGIAATATLNWNTIKEKLQGPVGEAVAVISGAALLLGILCLLVGLWPLGLGLIAAGAAGLVATGAANWDNLKDVGATAAQKVKEGWESAKETFEMVVEAVKSGAIEVWDAIKTKAETIKKTVETAVKRASTWVADAWKAAQMAGQTVTRKVQSVVECGKTFLADAWKAAQMKAASITRTLTQTVKDGAWSKRAWAAAKKKTADIKRKLTQSVKSGTWAADAWAAAKKGAASIVRTLTQSVAIGSWVSDAWTAAQKLGETIKRTLQESVEKGPTWVQEAFEAASAVGGTVKKTLQISISWIGEKLAEAWKVLSGSSNNTVDLNMNTGITGNAMPAMAGGTIVPPLIMTRFEGSYSVDDIVARLDRLLTAQERPIQINTAVEAKVNNKVLFSAVVQQGQAQKNATGKNPFNL